VPVHPALLCPPRSHAYTATPTQAPAPNPSTGGGGAEAAADRRGCTGVGEPRAWGGAVAATSKLQHFGGQLEGPRHCVPQNPRAAAASAVRSSEYSRHRRAGTSDYSHTVRSRGSPPLVTDLGLAARARRCRRPGAGGAGAPSGRRSTGSASCGPRSSGTETTSAWGEPRPPWEGRGSPTPCRPRWVGPPT